MIIQEIKSEIKIPTICLNMIVKNESKIITRLFDSVLPIIDCYCICDTGSTDNTVSVIEEYFKKKNIPGKVVCEPFKNFSYNRNFALKSCVGMSDYVLLLDADMILEIKTFDKRMLIFDCYNILQGSNEFFYLNMRIVRNLPKNGDDTFNFFKYVGATHEYISTPSNASLGLNFEKNCLFIRDIGDGGAKNDKFERDIRLLEEELKEKPNNERSYFYLANSYFCIGKFKEAIPHYKKRIEIGGWAQEVWYSYYRIGMCYKDLHDMPNAIYYWLEAYNFLPDRIENLYEIISHYRIVGKQKVSYLFYKIAKEIRDKKLKIEDYLFLENSIYLYKIDYELTIIASYNNINNINNEMMTIFNNCDERWIVDNLLSNMKFYKNILIPINTIDLSVNLFHKIGDKEIKFNSSSSCIIPNFTNDGYLMNMRLVNYRIDNNGNYLDCNPNIITINEYIELTKKFKIIKAKIFTPLDKDLNRLYIGVEDVRIFKKKDSLIFAGVGYHSTNKIGVVSGKYNINEDNLKPIELKPNFSNNDCEKNWVYVDYNKETHIIYNWYPLQICKIRQQTSSDTLTAELELIESRDMPKIFKYSRGSTCGFKYINNDNTEFWFINHIVSYETPREYYHIFAIFDKRMNLLQYSPPFKFEGEKIEYCLGIIVENDRVLCSYSTWDRTTKIGVYDKKYIDNFVCYK